eukprot:6752041-Lingulodinium_polyedra.AAC.1
MAPPTGWRDLVIRWSCESPRGLHPFPQGAGRWPGCQGSASTGMVERSTRSSGKRVHRPAFTMA